MLALSALRMIVFLLFLMFCSFIITFNLLIRDNIVQTKNFFAVLTVLFLGFNSSYSITAQAASCGTSGSLDTDDVTFDSVASDGCGGVFSGNNSNIDINTLSELDFGSTEAWGSEIKDNTPGGASSSGTGNFLGIDWTLTADSGTSGTWTLTIADPNPQDLPVTVDFLAVLKGSNNWGAYYFEDEVFDTEGSTNGSFQITFTNNGNKVPNLSHMSLYLRESQGVGPGPNPVPVPAAVWLFGSGLAGLLTISRRRTV